ncbi:MAG: hypothetical protein HY735_36305 [Verrucomicrobia bacterium]|nr:hypothetical protein [Verrucomicrobiota bacterium]
MKLEPETDELPETPDIARQHMDCVRLIAAFLRATESQPAGRFERQLISPSGDKSAALHTLRGFSCPKEIRRLQVESPNGGGRVRFSAIR